MSKAAVADYTHWKTADGELILVSSLSEDHLRNAVKFVSNCLCSYYLSNYSKPFGNGGEIVQWLDVLLKEANRRYGHPRDKLTMVLEIE